MTVTKREALAELLTWLRRSCSGGRSGSASRLEWISEGWTWNEWLCTGTGARFPSLPGPDLWAEKTDRGLRGGPTIPVSSIKHDSSILTIFAIKILHLSKLPKSSRCRDQLLIGLRAANAHLELNSHLFEIKPHILWLLVLTARYS